MYSKQFEIRWSDLDANLHLGNSKYMDFMSHTRMSFLINNNLDLEEMVQSNLGPVTLHEHIYYFKEVRPNETITVSLEVLGFTPDGRFLKFEHNFYDKEGVNLAYAEILFSWIDMKKRKIGTISSAILNKIESLPRAKNFKFLDKEDLKSNARTPKNIIES